MKTLFTAIVLVLCTVLEPAQAQQQAPKLPRVGFLSPLGPSSVALGEFRQGLADLGYVDGKNIIIEPRFAGGQYDRLPALAAELVNLKVDVIALLGAVTGRAAKKATTTIPIVFAIVVDPVGDDVVKSLQRPGENITGVTSFDPQQPRKQLELLKEVVPSLKRVAILADQGLSEPWLTAYEEQARALGLQPQRLLVAEPNPDLEGIFAAIRQAHTDAVLMLQEPVVVAHSKEIAELAAKERLPTMFPQSQGSSGGLIAYGTSVGDALRREAVYVDKILKGAKPGELSVETVTRYELLLNLKTARDIGATIPPEVIKRADRVIQ